MAEELRWALIVISALVIGGLLIHGLWSVRKKETPEHTDNTPKPQPKVEPAASSTDNAPELGDMNFSAVDEEYLLEIERESFISLCGEQKTIERIEYMLKKGKPLRN